MSDCCTTTTKGKNNRLPCPVNGIACEPVKRNTILHQVTKPWQRNLPDQTYYYCPDPECNLVYFAEDNTQIFDSDMRHAPDRRNATACFCFDISKAELASNRELCRSFIIEQTRAKRCSCETSNPSGKCCLKEIK